MGEELFLGLNLVAALPFSRHACQGGEAVLKRLTGARIVRIGGTNDDEPKIEGGGLIIDYVPEGGEAVERVVFAFNENGMWVVYEALPALLIA